MNEFKYNFDSMTEEEIDQYLMNAGYNPEMVGKYFSIIAGHEILKVQVQEVLDLLDTQLKPDIFPDEVDLLKHKIIKSAYLLRKSLKNA